MPKIPFYEQQTTVGSVRADPQAFGAGVAHATGEMGNVVADIGDQIMRRSETIEQAMLGRDLDLWGQESLTALRDTEDIMSPDTVAKYEAGLAQKKDELLGRFKGRTAARAALQASLENQTYQYVKSARAEQVKAQQQFIGSVVEQKANSLAISAGFAPEQIDNLMLEMDKQIDKFADALSPQVAQQYKEAGRSRLVTNAIYSLIDKKQASTAKALLQNPELGKYLDPDTSRRFIIDIAVDEGKAAQAAAETQKRLRSWAVRFGRDLTPAEVIRIESLPAEKKDMTEADKITRYELVTGKPAPQSVVDDIFGVNGGSGSGGMFGNSLRGRALAFVTENAPAYASGLLDPDQARAFEASYAEAYKPVMRPNPVTGQMEQITPTIPNFVAQALERGSRTYGGINFTQPTRAPAGQSDPSQQTYPINQSGNVMGGGDWEPGDTAQLTDRSGRMVGEAVVGPDGHFTIKGGGAAGGTQPAPAGEKTIWEMADDLAGPIPAAKVAVGDVAYIGGMIDGGGQTARNRAYVKTQVSQMVDALSINPRNPVALVEMIRGEIDVDPKVMGDPAAYRKRIEGVSRALTERLIEETAAGADPNLPAKTRQDALEVANTIRNFQQKLMPPQVKNRKELDQLGLPSGAKFIDPNGVLRRVP